MIKKTFVLLFLSILMFVNMGCNNNKKVPNGVDDFSEKMEAVTHEVEKHKKHDSALLLVSFGSTCDAPQKTFQAMKSQFAEKFKDMDVYFAFTSEICITRCAAKGLNYYSPSYYLQALGHAGYKTICVQSLHVIPGEEFLRVKNVVKDFHNNGDNPEFADVTVYLGGPLLNDAEDVETVAHELHKKYAKEVEAGKVVAFMGHGNPEDANYGNGNSRYAMLESAMQKLNHNYYVATVDMNGNLVTDMIERMKAAGVKEGTDVICHPLMSTAGDHANNDMLGGNDEKNPQEGSWRSEIVKAGFNCPIVNCHVVGLGDYPEFVNIWISHADSVMKAEPLYEKEK